MDTVNLSRQMSDKRPSPALLAFPIGEGEPRQRWIGYYRFSDKCLKRISRSSHMSFIPKHPIRPSATFPEGEGLRYVYTAFLKFAALLIFYAPHHKFESRDEWLGIRSAQGLVTGD